MTEINTPPAELIRQVRSALAHLYDYAYLQNNPLAALLDPEAALDRVARAQHLRRLLVDCIEALKPQGESAPGSQASRAYPILTYRYIDGLSMIDIARKRALSLRQAYREHEVTLPSELNEVQLHALVDKLVQALAGDKPHQYAIHAPVAALAGVRQPHMHLVASDRMPDGLTRPAEQMFRRFNPKAPNRGGCRKDSGGRLPLEVRDELIARRKMIAELQNEALADSGHDTRVDHRSHKERGIESQPERHLGPARIKHMTVEDKTEYLAGRAGAKKGGKA